MALVELATDSWIVTGRHPVPIMMAAVFISWQSLKPTKTRLRYSLNKFCRLSHMPLNKTAVRRVSEMKEVLCRLGREIPWLSVGDAGGTPDDVAQHVEDILQHRHALLRGALRSHEESMRAEEESQGAGEESQGAEEEREGAEEERQGAGEERQGTEEERQGAEEERRGPHKEPPGTKEERRGSRAETLGAAVQPSVEDPAPQAPSQEPDRTDQRPESRALRAVNGDPGEGGGETVSGVQEQRPAVHWGKRMLFAPPCARHAKVRRTDAAAWAEVNGDEEISDSEIDSYIRSPQEVRDYLQTQKLLLATTEDGDSGKK